MAEGSLLSDFCCVWREVQAGESARHIQDVCPGDNLHICKSQSQVTRPPPPRPACLGGPGQNVVPTSSLRLCLIFMWLSVFKIWPGMAFWCEGRWELGLFRPPAQVGSSGGLFRPGARLSYMLSVSQVRNSERVGQGGRRNRS